MSKPCGCGCEGARTERLRLRTAVTRRPPAANGKLQVDVAALRLALGGELVEHLQAKASGRTRVNAGRMWAMMTTTVYQSGDLPVIATREALQNSLDAIRKAVKARALQAGAGRFDVVWDEAERSLSWSDNGAGMDAETILEKFLVLGEEAKEGASDSNDAAGGFGLAKAVILGTSPTFRWEMHSRDNLAISKGAAYDVEVFDAPVRAGTRITIFDIASSFDTAYDYAQGRYVPLIERLKGILAMSDLPDLAITLNGEVVPPMFNRRGGSKVSLRSTWGPSTEGSVKAYRRAPGDRTGAYYVRLGGLIQFTTSSRRGNLKADVVVDLRTTLRPGVEGYPLNAGRDKLKGSASYAFQDLVEEVERENESAGDRDEDEIFDPEAGSDDMRQGASEIADLAASAFSDPAFQKALEEAAGGIVDFYSERVKDPGVQAGRDSFAPAGSRSKDDGPTRTMPTGMKVSAVAGESDIADLRAMLQAADETGSAGFGATVYSLDVRDALDKAERGTADGWDIQSITGAIDRAADKAMGPGGGGLLQVAAVTARGEAAMEAATPLWAKSDRAPRRNPFGRLAGLRISKKHYDRPRAARFRKAFQKWIPHLTVWDATLRMVAAEAQMRRTFKPGFVLDDEVIGLTSSGAYGQSAVVYLHPDRFAQVIKAHRERPLAIAAFVHGVAVHELTHLDGRMGKGHDEEFVSAREDLGHATGHLLAPIAILLQRILGLPVAPLASEVQLGKLQRQLARMGASNSSAATALKAEIAALKKLLKLAAAEGERARTECDARCAACGDPRDQVLRRVEAAVAAHPDVDPEYLRGFMVRNRAGLLALVG